jgi:Fungal specific transcription factor domain
LETRSEYLESLLTSNNIPFAPADSFVIPRTSSHSSAPSHGNGNFGDAAAAVRDDGVSPQLPRPDGEQDRVEKLVSSASKIAVHGTSDSRYLGSASGISFARVVFAAIKSVANASGAASERHTGRRGSIKSEAESNMMVRTSPTSMRESFFGLDTKSNSKSAPFPSRDLGHHLVNLYFQHANPQFPILHRLEFMDLVHKAYDKGELSLTQRESYLLNMVFAIGAGIIIGKPMDLHGHSRGSESPDGSEPPAKRRRMAEEQRPPEEYHAAAIVHLEATLGSNSSEGITGDLEELQAVLLLACFALLRPVPPGLWYIVGVGLRLAIDLGLHADDGIDIERPEHPNLDYQDAWKQRLASSPGMGRKQYLADFRRRLWWCVYSFDRLVSSVIGRPFGISDQMVTTSFPSILEDIHISQSGITYPAEDTQPISYKRVSFHYFRLRLLHSEILQVLSHRQTQLSRARGIYVDNKYMHTDLPCPFLDPFGGSFRAWREDVDRRLWEWQEEAPKQNETGVQFSPLFLELNYWQTVLMLYRQSLSTPVALADDANSAAEAMSSPILNTVESNEDSDVVFMKVAQAGQNVLKLYRKLHRKYLVNYTYLATHHLFMAGK